MRIPPDAIIADEKLLHYLLVPRPWDDKSRFLGLAGFTLDNWLELRDAIRQLCSNVDAVEDSRSVYGTFYRVDGELIGRLRGLSVTSIWLQQASDGRIRFITLKPRKEPRV